MEGQLMLVLVLAWIAVQAASNARRFDLPGAGAHPADLRSCTHPNSLVYRTHTHLCLLCLCARLVGCARNGALQGWRWFR